ncbi:glycerophosphoryl diester phosphodiesterase [Salinibacillus kushneri]|uniref:Glycerophosphoryl diester phosphodiesterase n=1 Tax=Salinibacillus kushneri TaxID=237682 RepID=A0A1I0HVL9_9BACI|nr:glycerophosphodiester phosphodiesterase [Salinibacillus kushneri]SET88113.1 glycerophosphoryl diester phosphodiesterase [Salinibacillus kushneri]
MRTRIFAHRGASQYAPENTMPAFQLAYEMNADGIETDVQLTKDEIPVLIHDENVRRTTNGTGFVQDYTLNELKQLDAGSWFSSSYTNTSIVTLEKFLQWISSKTLELNIEFKNNVIDYKNLENIVYHMVRDYGVLDRTTFSSFNPRSMERMNKLDPNVNTAFLTTSKVRRLTQFVQSIGCNGLHVKYRVLSTQLAEESDKYGIDLRVFTINRPAQMSRCFKLNCAGIFTDVPDLAMSKRANYPNNHNPIRIHPFQRR